ncbi:MAG: hypothetical protein WC155_04300 [Candidatus Cloacimonadales bacterium]
MREKILLILSILFCMNVLVAVPFGTLGNIDVPDGFVMPANQIAVNFASYLRDEAMDSSDKAGYDYNYVIQAKYGLFDRAEIGLVYTGDEIFYVNAKFQLVRESFEYPGITIGVDNLFSKVGTDAFDETHKDYHKWEDIEDRGAYERNSFYVAATKSWALRDVKVLGDMQLYVTVGIGVNRFVGQRDLAEDFSGLFGTFEYYPTQLFPKNNFSVFAEQSGHAINLGARYSWKNLGLQYSVIEIEEFIKDNQDNLKMAFNIQYSLTYWANTKTTQRGAFEPNKDRLRTNQQIFESGAGTGSSILDQIKALRAEELKRQTELNDLIKELEELD